MPAKLEASGIKKAIEYVNSGKSSSLQEASPEPEEAVTQLSDLPSPIEGLINPYTKDTISLSVEENKPVVIQSAFDQLSFLIALVIKKINSKYSILNFPNENIKSTGDVSGYVKEADVKNDASIRNFEIFRFRLHDRTLGINAGPTSEGTKKQIQFFNDVKKAFENIFREKEKFDALNPDELSLNLSGLYFEECAEGAVQSAKIAAEKIYFSDNHLKSFLDQYFQEQVCKILPSIREEFNISVHNEVQEGSYHIHHTSFIKAILYMTDKQLAGVPLLINAGDFFLNFPEFNEYYVQESFRNLFLAGQGESTTSEELAKKIAEKRDFLLSKIDPIPLEKIPSETSSLAKAQLNEAVESGLMTPMSATVGFASSLLEDICCPMPDLKKQLPDEMSIEDSFSLYWFLKKEGLIELGKWERSDGQLENIIRNECLRKILDKLIEDIEKSNGDSASPEPEPEIADRGRSNMDLLKRIKDDLKGGLHPEVVFGLIHLFYQNEEPSWSFSAFEQKTTKCEGGFEIKEAVIEEGLIDIDCLWPAKKAIKYINSPDPRGADTELAQDEKLKDYNEISEFGILKLNKTYYIIYKNEGERKPTFISKVSPQFLREFYAIPTQENALHQSNLKKLLIVAVEKNDIEEVEVCINDGADVNAADESGGTPLYWAASFGHAAVVTALVQAGADLEASSQNGNTALHRAAHKGHAEVVKLLLARGAAVDKADKGGNTALHLAATYGHAAVVRALVQARADLEASNQYGNTALHWAADRGHAAVVELLLARRAAVDKADKGGSTALIRAADKGHAAVVELLLARRAEVDKADKGGNTALHRVAATGNLEIASLLLDRGANKEAKNNDGDTALIRAASFGHAAVVTALVQARANPNTPNQYGDTALIIAADKGHAAVVTDLVEAGADLEASNQDGNTALHCAADRGHAKVVRALVQAGASKEAKAEHGITALHYAANNGHAAVVTVLVEKGADLKAKNNDGNTALHWAADKGHAAVVKALAQAGAYLEAKSNDGDTALIIAASFGHAAVVTALVQAGADPEALSQYGETALHYAEARAHAGIVVKIKKYIESGEYEWRQHLPRLRQAAREYNHPTTQSSVGGLTPEPELAETVSIESSDKLSKDSPVEDSCMDVFLIIATMFAAKHEIINPKVTENFAKIMAALSALEKYKGSRPDVAKAIEDRILELTELGEMFSSEGAIVGIDDIIKTLSDGNYAKVFKTTWFDKSLTTLQEVISDVSRMLGGESYPDPDSFVKLKESLDPKRKCLARGTQTDSNYSNFFQSAAEPEAQSVEPATPGR